MKKYGQNLHQPAERVRHADLTRSSTESVFRSLCPACKDGVLMVARDPQTFCLIDRDRCTRCAQLFIYEDTHIGGEIVTRTGASGLGGDA